MNRGLLHEAANEQPSCVQSFRKRTREPIARYDPIARSVGRREGGKVNEEG